MHNLKCILCYSILVLRTRILCIKRETFELMNFNYLILNRVNSALAYNIRRLFNISANLICTNLKTNQTVEIH